VGEERMGRKWPAFLLLFALFSATCREQEKIVLFGTIEARDAELASRLGGRVVEVHAREGDRVRRGQVLITLDRGPATAAVAEAAAALAEARARLRELRRGTRNQEIEQGRARAEAARARAQDARANFRRGRELYRQGVISAREFDRVKAAHEAADARWREALERVALLEEGPRPEQITAAAAAVKRARAVLRRARLDLREATVKAPWQGIIEVLDLEPGDFVAPGLPLVTLADPNRLWVRAYVPENLLGWVPLGAEAFVTVDSFPGRSYRGRVEFVATEAEFIPRNIQTREDRALQVYGIKVALVEREDLRAGMAAEVIIERAPASRSEAGG